MRPHATSARPRARCWSRCALAVVALGTAAACSTGATTGGPGPALGSSQAAAPSPTTVTRSASPTPGPREACLAEAGRMSEEQLSLQVIIAPVDATAGVEPTRDLLAAGLGGVIYLPGNDQSIAAVRALSDEVHAAGRVTPLIVLDQEGGSVVRFQGPGFAAVPSAVQQAGLDEDELRQRAARWGTDLASAGIDVNLAPVADVLPAGNVATNQALGRWGRSYGADPDAVGRRVAAVARGFRDGGLGVTLKHYPGLGHTTTNTDDGPARDEVTTLDSADLAPFATNAPLADLVMVSNATYARIDPSSIAAFSPLVLQRLRTDLRYDGPIVSDDLGIAGAVADVPMAERGTRFVAAGGDLLITVDRTAVPDIARGLSARASADRAFRGRLVDAAARVLALKEKRGLHRCG